MGTRFCGPDRLASQDVSRANRRLTSGRSGHNQRQSSYLTKGVTAMIGILIAILVAALVYWLCVALGLPAIVGIVAAILVLIGGVGTGVGGWGRGGRTVR